MNNVTVCGNVGRDGEIKYLPDGTAALVFSVADNRGKDKKPMWWNCSIFGKRAESLQKWITKGRQVTVVGTVSEREYKDKATGESKHSLDVRVSDINLAFDDNHGDSKPTPVSSAAPRQHTASPSGFDDMDNDIPF